MVSKTSPLIDAEEHTTKQCKRDTTKSLCPPLPEVEIGYPTKHYDYGLILGLLPPQTRWTYLGRKEGKGRGAVVRRAEHPVAAKRALEGSQTAPSKKEI